MFQDLILYARFKIKLLKISFANNISGVVFSDVVKENKLEDRAYQGYALLLYAAVCVAMWFFLLDAVAELFQGINAEAIELIFQSCLLIPILLFVALAFIYLRSSPWKMSYPDISFVATSRLDTRAIIVWESLAQLVWWFAVALLFAYVLGEGLQSSAAIALHPISFSAFYAAAMSAALLWAWVFGVIRLTLCEKKQRPFSGGILLVIAAVSLVACFIVFLLSISFFMSILAWIELGIAVLSICAFVIMINRAQYIDVTFAIGENTYYADMHSIRRMAFYDPSGHAEIKRKKQVERRGPIWSVSFGERKYALVSRAILSHIRQFEGLFSIMFWAMGFLPLTTILLTDTQSPFLWVVWVQILIVYPKGVREITRVFRDNLSNRLIGDHIRVSVYQQFIFSSAPAFFLALAISFIALFFIFPFGFDFFYACGICVLAHATFTLCAAVDGLVFFPLGRKMSYEILAIIAAVVLFLLSFGANPYYSLLYMAAYSMALLSCLRSN